MFTCTQSRLTTTVLGLYPLIDTLLKSNLTTSRKILESDTDKRIQFLHWNRKIEHTYYCNAFSARVCVNSVRSIGRCGNRKWPESMALGNKRCDKERQNQVPACEHFEDVILKGSMGFDG